ncbi:CtsR family transcriptional regulator [Clostridium sp. 19966]|uniref:CtsR family transcriptional regulator n=1 Tax=Clostridium sp. 19966 TaxID=2768166 RepID=UPI0028DF5EF6|nr:CtsR family transcriptional regulator [Clostridium sp. 19966]MDT8715784.1 CtsR family transcriptional regulator [Clostridium sp. 19966]
MARLSDIIEEFIKDMLENSRERELTIQRNELANQFSCAPSQINYVLTTRFTTDKGYCIESRRGGGGCIVIKRVQFNAINNFINAIMENIGENITYDKAALIIDGLFESDIVTDREAAIMKVAINDRSLSVCENRNKLRADIFKAMLIMVCH